jgi:hypothetical protein
MTPLEAVHRFCVQCVGSPFDVRDCGGNRSLNGGCYPSGECWFWKHRLGKGRPSVKTIRRYCLWCQGDSADLVRECVERMAHSGVEACPLYPYRMGKNPHREGVGTAKNFAGKQAVSGGFGA